MGGGSLIAESARQAAAHAGFLPSVVAVAAVCAILRGLQGSPWKLALLALPGTFAHELAHYAVGAVLGARPHGFTVWPRRDGGMLRLGAVSFSSVNLLNGAWVSLAPLLLTPLAVLAFVHLLLPLWDARLWIVWAVASYVTGNLLYAALPSWQDLRLGARSIVFYAAIALAAWLAWR